MNDMNKAIDVTDCIWRKSTASQVYGDCVEIYLTINLAHVRDSKSATGEQVWFSARSWSAFLAAVSAGGLA